MRIGLCAGFGEDALGAEALGVIRSLGREGIRRDCPSDDKVNAGVLVQEIKDAGLFGLCLIGCGQHVVEQPAVLGRRGGMIASLIRDTGLDGAIEVANEPDESDVYRGRPDLLAAAINAVYALACGVPVVIGGMCRMTRANVDILARVCELVPPDVIAAVHTYRDENGNPHTPRAGFASRTAEFRAIQAAVGARRLWCTEVGFHNGQPSSSWLDGILGKKRKRMSEEESCSNLREEHRLLDAEGFEWVFDFQHHDGPGENERWGILRADGSLKPSAYITQEAV